MLYLEFSRKLLEQNVISPDSSLCIEEGDEGSCIVDGFRALPLDCVSSLLPRGHIIEVNDESHVRLAELLLCKGGPFDIPRFSSLYLAAYLAEVADDDYGRSGHFKSDYLLIKSDRINDYRNSYMKGSSIWGGIQHPLEQTSLTVSVNYAPIQAVPNLSLPTDIHAETARRSVQQAHAFERYLKLYHLLELSFDLDVVERIRALGDDLKGIGQIFSSLESKELERLKSIVRRCRNPSNIVAALNSLTTDAQWHPYIRTIFFDFGKDGNPLVNHEAGFFDALATGGFTPQSLRSFANIQKGPWDITRQARFELFTLDLASYWIYRTRSSVAHSRLGEYVMRNSDEPFVASFAEPLLRAVLLEVL